MREEKFFDADGFYQFIVDKNVLLHKEAVTYGVLAIEPMLDNINKEREIKVLDLACGGQPISICEIISQFEDRNFSYTGIDINQGQVSLASKKFKYPGNVSKVNVMEGDAWNFPSEITKDKYNIIFTGLNLHHGSPSELYVLFKRILNILETGGVLVNHDMYRPREEKYIYRPQSNPNDPSESYLMIPNEQLELYQIPHYNLNGLPFSEKDQDDWRLEFLAKFSSVLSGRGGDAIGIESACRHVYARDFCLSTDEMKRVAESAGFNVSIQDYQDSSEPMRDYYATLVGRVR